MKKLTATIAAAILATTAGAQSYYDSDNNMVYARSNEHAELMMFIDVDPVNGCNPVLVLSGTGYNPNETVTYLARVDRKEPWTVTGRVSHSSNGAFSYFSTTSDPLLITELRRGHTLRLKLPRMDDTALYTSFSLIGFSRAFSKAKAACIPPSQYFEQNTRSTDNTEYFL